MTKLEQKLIQLGYEKMALCWRKDTSENISIILSKSLPLTENYIFNSRIIKSQQDINLIQQAFNKLQNDLKELKEDE